MTGYLLSDGKETIDKIMEVAPFIVIGGLWLLGAIAKAVQTSKKNEQAQPNKKPVQKRQPQNLADFIRIVKEQYASATQQATKAYEQPIMEFTTPATQPAFEKAVDIEPSPAKESDTFTPKISPAAEETPVTIAPSDTSETYSYPYLEKLTKQFASVDGLRMAVLYSEILNRPVGLRRQL